VKKALLFVMFVAVVLVVAAGVFYLAARNATPKQNKQGASCDISLWAHVYHGRFTRAEDRLHIIDPCISVSGIIMEARREKDGDWHVLLDLDSEFSSLLNQANLEKQNGRLVLEPICSNPVTQSDTLEEGVCEGFTQNIFGADFIGQKVVVTGAYVVDMEHGWTEIHPATSIVPVN
jgi:hypothetical protein